MGTAQPARMRVDRWWRALAAAVALPLVLLTACSVDSSGDDRPVSADVNDFSFESMDVDYELSRAEDGTSRLRVVETFVAVFPEYDQNRGMQRRLDESYLDVPLNPELVSVTDGDGRARPVETESEDGVLAITSRA